MIAWQGSKSALKYCPGIWMEVEDWWIMCDIFEDRTCGARLTRYVERFSYPLGKVSFVAVYWFKFSTRKTAKGENICIEYLHHKDLNMTKGPIIIIEDDIDDQEVYLDALKTIGIPNEIRFFSGGEAALNYLANTEEQPFIILSDINMPGMSGLQLKKTLQEDPYLAAKGVPFVFISTNATNVSVRHAHALSVQGYFEKPTSMDGLTAMLGTLFAYWELCKHINNTL